MVEYVVRYLVSGLEVSVLESVGESLSADTDTLEHTVTSQLVQNQVWFNQGRGLALIGHDATDEMGLSAVQCRHQFVQLVLKRIEQLVDSIAQLNT